MPLDDRDYIRGRHPTTCTCTECVNRRLKRLRKEAHPNYISVCPRCGKKSLFYNGQDRIYECLNLKCKALGHTPEEIKGYSGSPKEAGRTSHPTKPTSKKLRYPKPLKNLIRLCLNLAVLAGLGVLVRHSYFLFTHKLSPLSGSIALIIGITIWVLLIIFLNKKYRWVKPSFKLTTFLTIVVLLIFAFAGVQPMSTYKDTLVEKWRVTTTPSLPQPTPEPTPFKLFSDESTGFSTEYPENWTYTIINMEDRQQTRVTFVGKINGILCELLIGYDPTFTDVKGLWTSMVNLAGSSLKGKEASIKVGGVQGYELAQEISGKTSRIFVASWKSGSLLATRSYPSNTLSPNELSTLDSYFEHLIASAFLAETPKLQEPTPVKPPIVTKYTLQEVASQIHTLINSERTKQGLSPLRVDILLTSLAEEHSESMVLNGFFGHERALGERSFGYSQQPGTLRGENISKTPQRRVIPGPYLTLEEVCTWVVSGWMSSPGHRNNILKPKFTRTGIGVSLLGEYLYITQIFEGTY